MQRTILKVAVGAGLAAVLALGGAKLAGASGITDDGGHLSPAQAAQAKSAALQATGGGTVNAMELDSEAGATYEVEVTRPDGKTVDVRLDGSYGVVVIDGDDDTAADTGS